MKMFVLSNIPGSTDRVIDALGDSVNVVAKESAMTTDALAGIVSEQMQKHAYDMVLVLAKDPIAAGMLMNKQEGIEAAVCSSADDVSSASESGANVIILKDPKSKDMDAILYQVTQSKGLLKGLKLSVKLPKPAPKPEAEEKEEDEEKEPAPPRLLKRKEKPKQEEPEPEQADDAQRPPRKGITGKIKDYLGIV